MNQIIGVNPSLAMRQAGIIGKNDLTKGFQSVVELSEEADIYGEQVDITYNTIALQVWSGAGIPANNVFDLRFASVFHISGTVTFGHIAIIPGITPIFLNRFPTLPIDQTMTFNGSVFMKAGELIRIVTNVTVQPCEVFMSYRGILIPTS